MNEGCVGERVLALNLLFKTLILLVLEYASTKHLRATLKEFASVTVQIFMLFRIHNHVTQLQYCKLCHK